jgi:hypothetical protein
MLMARNMPPTLCRSLGRSHNDRQRRRQQSDADSIERENFHAPLYSLGHIGDFGPP